MLSYMIIERRWKNSIYDSVMYDRSLKLLAQYENFRVCRKHENDIYESGL